MNNTLTFSDANTAIAVFDGALDRDAITVDWMLGLSKQEQQSLKAVKQLRLNLKSVQRADTAGLAWLINIARDAKQQNIEVIFDNVPSKLINLAELSGANTILQA